MKHAFLLVAATLGLATLGCQNKEEAQKKCRAFLETVCERRIACGPVEQPKLKPAECMAQIAGEIDCEKAVGWNDDNFEVCLEDFRARSCDDFKDPKIKTKLPESCQRVILITD